MNVYTCNDFEGHYPVGTAAVIVAANEVEARLQLQIMLQSNGLPQGIDPDFTLELVNTETAKTIILRDGEY